MGAKITYTSSETTYNPTSAGIKGNSTKGLNDPDFYFTGNNTVGAGAIHYGADLSFSLENSTYNSKDGTSNAATGGYKFIPYFGYDFLAGAMKLGGKIAYDLIRGDRSSKSTSSSGTVTSSTSSGGNELALTIFGEIPVKASTLGLSLGYASSSATETTTNGSTTKNNNELSTYMGSLYGAFSIGNVDLLGTITYADLKFADKSYTDYIDSYGGWKFDFGARFAF